MIIEYEGERYEWEFDDVTIKQAIKIEKHVGVKLTEWGDLLAEGDHWTALQALGWVVLLDGKGAIDDADFKIGPLSRSFLKAIAAQAEAEKAAAGPVPTVAVPASNGHQPDAVIPAASTPSSVPASP